MTDKPKEIAFFQVHVTAVADANWQGMVDIAGEQYPFRSELQLLELVMEHFPALRPETAWETGEKHNANKNQNKIQ